jgi:hypothetical protein
VDGGGGGGNDDGRTCTDNDDHKGGREGRGERGREEEEEEEEIRRRGAVAHSVSIERKAWWRLPKRSSTAYAICVLRACVAYAEGPRRELAWLAIDEPVGGRATEPETEEAVSGRAAAAAGESDAIAHAANLSNWSFDIWDEATERGIFGSP